MAQVDDIRRLYAERAVAAGVAQYAPDGSVQLPDGATVRISPGEAAVAKRKREAVPSRVDLSSGMPEHTLVLRRANGEAVEVHVLVTTGSLRKREWYARRMADLSRRMFPSEESAIEDEAEFDRMDKEYSTLMHAQARLMMPDLPEGIFDDLNPATLSRCFDAVSAIIDEAMGADEKNELAAPRG